MSSSSTSLPGLLSIRRRGMRVARWSTPSRPLRQLALRHWRREAPRHCASARQGYLRASGGGQDRRSPPALSDQFAAHGRDGRLERAYLAFVWGVPERPAGAIATGIGRSTANRQKQAVSNRAIPVKPSPIMKCWNTMALPPASSAAALKQAAPTIRVHMAHIGHPLLGDGVYGAGHKTAAKRLSEMARLALNALKGQALHAAILGFEHPKTGRALRFEASPPEDL